MLCSYIRTKQAEEGQWPGNSSLLSTGYKPVSESTEGNTYLCHSRFSAKSFQSSPKLKLGFNHGFALSF